MSKIVDSLIKKVRLVFLSDAKTLKLSFGPIVNSKTLSTRSFRPEPGGFFDTKIFGPFVSFQCYCVKYKGQENVGKECERCGTLIARKEISRYRMGHISLISPVVNMIIAGNLLPYLGRIFDISSKELEDIIYFNSSVVISPGFSKLLKKKQVIDDKDIDYNLVDGIFDEIINTGEELDISSKNISRAKKLKNELLKKKDVPELPIFLEDYIAFFEEVWNVVIMTGAEALSKLISEIKIDEELKRFSFSSSAKSNDKNREVYRFLLNIKKNNINLNDMVKREIAVLPRGLREAVRLKGLIAVSQINSLYRKIFFYNRRLEDFLKYEKMGIGIFFGGIKKNEMKGLQKAYDALLIGSSPSTKSNSSSVSKSLSQSLSGKDGMIRRDSLGKRVDYSARSVIVPDPNLKFDQVGIPVKMAINLLEFIIIRKILEEKIVSTVREAKKLISNEDPVVFSILNEIVKKWPVLINRAPSLHRPSIQGFYISLTSGNSIGLHPLQTPPFNADHDGDNVNVFAPQTGEECREIENLVLSIHHTVDPKNGFLINTPNQEIVLGVYYLSIEKKNDNIKFFDNLKELEKAFHYNIISLNDLILIPLNILGRKFFGEESNKFIVTTFGKVIFNKILPPSFPYFLNSLGDFNIYDKSKIERKFDRIFDIEELDFSLNKINILPSWRKKDLVDFLNHIVRFSPKMEIVKFLDDLKDIGFEYSTYSGISISPFELSNPFEEGEKEKEVKKTWLDIDKVNDFFSQGFYSKDERKKEIVRLWEKCKTNLQNKLINFLDKKSNFSFYHIWKSEARASSENLTHMFAMRGLTLTHLGQIIEFPVISSIWEGLLPFELVISAFGVIKGMVDIALRTAEAGYLTRRLVEASQDVVIRFNNCNTEKSMEVNIDDNFSFESDLLFGCYLAEDILMNDELILSKNILILNDEINLIKENKIKFLKIRVPLFCESIKGICQKCYGADISKPGESVSIGSKVGILAAQSLGEPGTQLTMRTFKSGGFRKGDEGESGGDIVAGIPRIKQVFDNVKPSKNQKAIIAKEDGEIAEIEGSKVKQSVKSGKFLSYDLGNRKSLFTYKVKDKIKKGDILIDGKIDLKEYLLIFGIDKCQDYIIKSVEEVYFEQGISVSKKHFHIIVRQMFSRVIVEESGDSEYVSGDLVSHFEILENNRRIVKEGKKPSTFKIIISSLKDLASNSGSFLSDISFQRTIWNLVHDSVKCPIDYLDGIKSNLIVGNLLPF